MPQMKSCKQTRYGHAMQNLLELSQSLFTAWVGYVTPYLDKEALSMPAYPGT